MRVDESFQLLEVTHVQHPTFGNLNILHYACYTGNVYLMEKAVAAGAALDVPVLTECTTGPFPAPPGTTALVLACSVLATAGSQQMSLVRGYMTPMRNEFLEILNSAPSCWFKCGRTVNKNWHDRQIKVQRKI